MRIAFMNYWFSEGMGYSENLLPAAIARLGHEVHLVTSDAQVYYDSPAYARTYEPFLGPPVVPCGVRRVGEVSVHRLPRLRVHRLNGVRGLVAALHALRPDIVQGFETFDLMAVEAALARPVSSYKLFLESHVHRSVLDAGASRAAAARTWLYGRTLGRVVAGACERCYAISPDAAEVAHELFGMSTAKLEVCSLGVDTTSFRPVFADASLRAVRDARRRALGIEDGEVVCVYTGRFSSDKDALTLADAIAILRSRGRRFRGLFVGAGEQEGALRSRAGCVVHAFVAARDLPPFYWASDIGVWPRQESTSQLDAAACGLPVVISDRAEVRDRVDGNGAVYREGDAGDLARALESLEDATRRLELGTNGARRMQQAYSWDSIALRRVRDYEEALSRTSRSRRDA